MTRKAPTAAMAILGVACLAPIAWTSQDAKQDAQEVEHQDAAAPATQAERLIEAFRAQWAKVQESGNASYETWVQTQEQVLGEVDFDTLTQQDIAALLAGGLLESPSLRQKAQERLEAMRSQVDSSSQAGLSLAIIDAQLRGMPTRTSRPDPQLQAELFKAVFEHPALREGIRTGHAAGLGRMLASMPTAASKDAVVRIGSMLAEAPPSMAEDVILFWQGLERVDGLDKQARESIRRGLVQNLRQALAATDEQGQSVLGDEARWVREALARMDGAAARGELIGHPMPEMTITWSSDPSIRSFDDLKGKVVVLDFWATWCGPCIASFPKVQELKDHYAGKPVAIVGVTSLQGMVYGVPGEDGPVVTEDDPQKEYELMPAVMERHKVTWPVVFTEQDVFNPDFGVNGIPHVAIVDAQGIVRFNGLHPAEPLANKTEKIDALLREMGAQPPATQQEADDKDGKANPNG
ncbi:MAG: hypothetical protein KatS3mg103_0942 [Phycisphaerales bacterium]|nr:MAG: hypothetical protein KatS3mg103_0942 [Phycisphaerales bacterium]